MMYRGKGADQKRLQSLKKNLGKAEKSLTYLEREITQDSKGFKKLAEAKKALYSMSQEMKDWTQTPSLALKPALKKGWRKWIATRARKTPAPRAFTQKLDQPKWVTDRLKKIESAQKKMSSGKKVKMDTTQETHDLIEDVATALNNNKLTEIQYQMLTPQLVRCMAANLLNVNKTKKAA